MKTVKTSAMAVVIATFFILIGIFLPNDLPILLTIFGLGFFQNMAFTWSSRSRNSGDPDYHRYAAWGSNGVWFIMQVLIITNVFVPISEIIQQGTSGREIITLIATALSYIFGTSEGSVAMMRLLLSKEKGKRKVGATNE